ncbi:MAG TPA: FAD-dependent oxidoreductase [Ignavibacteriaceae bacterium]|nr:FAD-dependent oxidoreductase [Ignavibacteriaceae bacterium]
MKLPFIILTDDDSQVLRAVQRDVRKKFRDEYKVLATESAIEAVEAVKELKSKNETVALFLSDQRMPEMDGTTFLEKASEFFPDAKKVLLTAYSDIEAAIKAINTLKLDYYLLKPWNPPEEKLYPVLTDLLDDWQGSFIPEFEGIKIIGYQWSPVSHKIKDFLTGHLIPYRWYDIELNKEAVELLDMHKIDPGDLPVVIFEDGTLLKNPGESEVASKIGLKSTASEEMYDVVIIGAGPAGLAAAVYGGTEGLKTLMIEKKAPGGQAGTSSRIENYLGFPAGLSGADLTRRALTQAMRFGVEMLTPCQVVDISTKDGYKILSLSNGPEIKTRTIIISTGVDYRTLDIKGANELNGAGVYYGSATAEAHSCKGKTVFVVGGGNSAGQSAMYLSGFAERVNIVIRKNSLDSTMSRYLIDQINRMKNISLISGSVVIEAIGKNRLECITLQNIETGNLDTREAAALFIFIGARPVTDWIRMDIFRDSKGFIETGRDLFKSENLKKIWKLDRDPYPLETCIPGIFCAGDVRSGAMNRVASAVGEGAMAIKLVHEYLAEI